MNKLLLSLCLSFLFTMVWAQHEFQPGYVVKNGQRIDCLIKNEGWFRAPEVISYKFENQDKINMAPANEFDGFYIEDTKYKYVSRHFQPLYNKPATDMYLLVLVEGKASLYQFNSASGEKYYYEAEDGKLKELEYKSTIQGSKLKEEFVFRGQIFQDLECKDITKSMLQSIEYQKKKLVSVFNTYNECSNAEYTDLTIFKEKGEINLYILVGTSLFDVNTSGSTNSSNAITAPSNISIKAGVELEYILPIRNKKLSFFTGANYSKNNIDGEYKARLQVPSAGTNFVLDTKYEYDYDLLSIPLGFRFYMYLNQNHAFYINPGVSYNMILSENHYEFNYNNAGQSVGEGSLDDGLGFFTGIGYKFKSKFGAEIRFISARNIQIDDYTPNSTSLVAMISYNLF